MLSPFSHGRLQSELLIRPDTLLRLVLFLASQVLVSREVVDVGEGLLEGGLAEGIRQNLTAAFPALVIGPPAMEKMVQSRCVKVGLVLVDQAGDSVGRFLGILLVLFIDTIHSDRIFVGLSAALVHMFLHD